jgi:hypothetical protein
MPNIKGRRLTLAQADVYAVIKEFGHPKKGMPDHALVPLAQHAAGLHQSSSGIRTRRHELYELGLLEQSRDIYRTASGRTASAWRVAV